MKSKIIEMKIVHRKKEDRAEVIADQLFEKWNGNQQEDEDGENLDLTGQLLESIRVAKQSKKLRDGLK